MKDKVSIIINGTQYDAVETEKPKCEGCAFFESCMDYKTNCGFIEEMHGEYHFIESGKNFKPEEVTIKWNTGMPKETGNYVITTIDGDVRSFRFCNKEIVDLEFFERFVSAWFKLSDIRPYKNGAV